MSNHDREHRENENENEHTDWKKARRLLADLAAARPTTGEFRLDALAEANVSLVAQVLIAQRNRAAMHAPQGPSVFSGDAKHGQDRDALALGFAAVINANSGENGSDTPDFILAEHLVDCLLAFDRASRSRQGWYAGPPGPDSGSGANPRRTDPRPVTDPESPPLDPDPRFVDHPGGSGA